MCKKQILPTVEPAKAVKTAQKKQCLLVCFGCAKVNVEVNHPVGFRDSRGFVAVDALCFKN